MVIYETIIHFFSLCKHLLLLFWFHKKLSNLYFKICYTRANWSLPAAVYNGPITTTDNQNLLAKDLNYPSVFYIFTLA